jgi:sulfide:quinone oxidoreductase
MDLRELTDELFVSGQIEPADIPLLAARGIRAIVCNRPDGEAEGQPDAKAVEEAAAAHGIAVIYQPVVASAIGDADVAAFDSSLKELPKPVMAYCRTGTRCTALWSLSQAGKLPIQEILQKAMRAGYDMSPIVPRLEMARRQ